VADDNTVSLADLARMLDVGIDRLPPLISAGYLYVAKVGDTPETILLVKPFPDFLEWLGLMLGPTCRRPMVPIADIAHMLKMKPEIVRYACEKLSVEIWPDPVFGDLLSPRGFFTLQKLIERTTAHLRLDRQILMVMLARLRGVQPKFRLRGRDTILPYAKGFEAEIRRIAKMKEPMRAFRAVALWKAYSDADALVNWLPKEEVKAQKNKAGIRVTNLMARVANCLTGDDTWGKKTMRISRQEQPATSEQGDGEPSSGV
jgi:hypothetical protein